MRVITLHNKTDGGGYTLPADAWSVMADDVQGLVESLSAGETLTIALEVGEMDEDAYGKLPEFQGW